MSLERSESKPNPIELETNSNIELSNVVQQLESRKAQAKSIKSRADFARIRVVLTQRPPRDDDDGDDDDDDGDWAFTKWSPAKTARRFLRVLSYAAVLAADAAIVFAMALVPISVVVLLVRLVASRVGRPSGGVLG